MDKDNLDAIVDDIVSYADGSFHIEWGEQYETLTSEEQSYIHDRVFAQIENCDDCGWYFPYESLEEHPVTCGRLCMSCYDLADQEEE